MYQKAKILLVTIGKAFNWIHELLGNLFFGR